MKERVKRVVGFVRSHRVQFIVLTVLIIALTVQTHQAAALFDSGSSSTGGGIIDSITDALSDFFHAIIDGFKSFFNAIIDAVKWPFTQVKYMFSNVYNWSWAHLGPLGVVVFVAIAGMTSWMAIFWFKQNIEQLKY